LGILEGLELLLSDGNGGIGTGLDDCVGDEICDGEGDDNDVSTSDGTLNQTGESRGLK